MKRPPILLDNRDGIAYHYYMMNATPASPPSLLDRLDDSKRAVANLMARENITVQVLDGAKTARFDTVRRILTIPNWRGMSVDQCDLLIAHEVGHALFTDTSFIKDLVEQPSKGLHTYFNIVEDTRIERKMKNSFPGLARVFYNGYREFHANGPIFKGDQTTLTDPRTGARVNIASMKFIDRINLHYKIGAFVTVPFSEIERGWLAKIDKCASVEEALKLARGLQAFAKEQARKAAQPPPPPPPPSKDDDQGDDQGDESGDQPEAESDPVDADDSDDQDDSDSDDQEGESDQVDDNSDDQDDSASDDSDSDDSDAATESDESDDSDDDAASTESADASDDADDDSDADDADASSGSDDDDADDSDTDDGDTDDGDADDADGDADDADGDDSDGDGDQGDSDGDDSKDDDEAETGDFDDVLQDFASDRADDAQPINVLVAPLPASLVAERTMTAAEWSRKATEKLSQVPSTQAAIDAIEAKWEAEFGVTAQHMAVEFERRKNAKAMQNVRIARTGRLNMGKLHAYKFTDDLFLRSMQMPNGKSHGIVVIIDGSGSMTSVFPQVLDQVLLFAHFAYRIDVPFEAYMFTDRIEEFSNPYGRYSAPVPPKSLGPLTLTIPNSARLVGLVNTTTDRAGFKRQVRAVLAYKAAHQNPFGAVQTTMFPYGELGGTPLDAGIMLAEAHVARLKAAKRLDKMTFVVISDGQDTNGLFMENPVVHRDGTVGSEMVEAEHGSGLIARDLVTKKNFMSCVRVDTDYAGRERCVMPNNGMTTLLLDIIEARHACRNVFLFLGSASASALGYSFRRRRRAYRRGPGASTSASGALKLANAVRGELTRPSATVPDLEPMATALQASKQYAFPAGVGIAALTVVMLPTALAMDENTFEKMDTAQMTQKAIAKAFVAASVKNVANRVFINTLIPMLA